MALTTGCYAVSRVVWQARISTHCASFAVLVTRRGWHPACRSSNRPRPDRVLPRLASRRALLRPGTAKHGGGSWQRVLEDADASLCWVQRRLQRGRVSGRGRIGRVAGGEGSANDVVLPARMYVIFLGRVSLRRGHDVAGRPLDRAVSPCLPPRPSRVLRVLLLLVLAAQSSAGRCSSHDPGRTAQNKRRTDLTPCP